MSQDYNDFVLSERRTIEMVPRENGPKRQLHLFDLNMERDEFGGFGVCDRWVAL